MSRSKIKSLANLPTLGPGEKIGEGDSYIKYDLIDPKCVWPKFEMPANEVIFDLLHKEVNWQTMHHAAGEVPRLVAVQGDIKTDGSRPIYRHPSDQSPQLMPFTPNVLLVKEACEQVIGHSLNHVLIQLYRSGSDNISEHSDKTLDIVHESNIVNASFGARRTMRLRSKKKGGHHSGPGELRETQRIHMPHNSLFVLGLKTNQSWLHGINADKRISAERTQEELSYNGMRISLTFRNIGTFLNEDETKIWGQGAKGKTQGDARPVVSGDGKETERMIHAFGRENHEHEMWNWEASYGKGFDVLHFRA